jgi:DNA-directed RNA polymerase sigma subunit (sigma70/sigma32)
MFISRYGKIGQSIYFSEQSHNMKAVVGKAQAMFIQENHRPPTINELSEITGIPAEKISKLHVVVSSLDRVAGSESGSETLADLIPDDTDTEITSEKSVLTAEIMGKLSKLPDREQTVITHLFGLNGEKPLSLRKTASRMGLSAEGVRKIKNSAIIRLREKQLFE